MSKRSQILILDEIGPEWWGMISAKTVTDQLTTMQDADEIEVLINSPGGIVDEGTAIFNLLIDAGKTQKIITKCIGQAASISALIFLAGSERVMLPGTKVMIHQASSGGWGKGDELIKKGQELIEESNNIFDLMMNRSDKIKSNETKLREYFDAETYIFADECVELGIAHSVEVLPKAYNFSPNKMFSTMFDTKKMQSLMTKMERFLSGKKMSSVQTEGENSITVYFDGELKEGTELFTDEAMTKPVDAGDYVIGGTTYTVSGGKITGVKAESSAAATDVADDVILNLAKALPNGEHVINGKTVVVADGVATMKVVAAADPEKDELRRKADDLEKKMNAEKARADKATADALAAKNEMKAIADEFKTLGFGSGLDVDDPAKKKDRSKMSRKELLLMQAETMESLRERADANSK